MRVWKVGELARETGLTVRTLHHWDELALLKPSGRSESGYRLYGEEDVARLQRIVSLRQLGFPLDGIRECLERPEFSTLGVLEMHLESARRRLSEAGELVRRLEAVAAHLRSNGTASPEALISTIEATIMFEKYYTPEQLETLRQRAEHIGPERMQQVQEEWPRLIAEVRAEMERGTDPADPRVLELARRWNGLIAEFTGGDPGIARSLSNLYQGEPSMREKTGMDPALSEYVGRAQAGLK
jgi:MerR family transcriptional regulator, thiopeptide resistance regulator